MEIRYRPLNPSEPIRLTEHHYGLTENPAVVWRVFEDAMGLRDFSPGAAEGHAGDLCEEGFAVQVWDGAALAYELPERKETTGEADGEDDLLPPARQEANVRLLDALDRLAHLRGDSPYVEASEPDREEVRRRSIPLFLLYNRLNHLGLIPEPGREDGYPRNPEDNRNAIRRALRPSDAEIALAFTFRSMEAGDEATALEEADRALYWFGRAFTRPRRQLWSDTAAEVLTCATCQGEADRCIRVRETALGEPREGTEAFAVCGGCVESFWRRTGEMILMGETPPQPLAGTPVGPFWTADLEREYQTCLSADTARRWAKVRELPAGMTIPEAGREEYEKRQRGRAIAADVREMGREAAYEKHGVLGDITGDGEVRWTPSYLKEIEAEVTHETPDDSWVPALLAADFAVQLVARHATEALLDDVETGHTDLVTVRGGLVKRLVEYAFYELHAIEFSNDAAEAAGADPYDFHFHATRRAVRDLPRTHPARAILQGAIDVLEAPNLSAANARAEKAVKLALKYQPPTPPADTPEDRQEEEASHEREHHATPFHRAGDPAGPVGPADGSLPAGEPDEPLRDAERPLL